jgi:hypothetical protein
MLAHYYISWSNLQSDSIRRAKRKRVVQQILLYENFLALIALLHGRAAYRIFRFPRQVFDARLASFATDGRSRKVFQKITTRHNNRIALYNMAHGEDGDVVGGSTGLKNPTALKYLYEVVLAICSETTSEMDW